MNQSHAVRTLALLAGLGLATPVLAQEQGAMPTVESSAGRVVVKRGETYLEITPQLVIQRDDSLVLFEGASATLKCGDDTLTSFNEVGIYSIPACPARVAAAVPPSSGTTPAAGAGTGSGGATAKQALAGAAVIVGAAAATAAIASGFSSDEDNKPASP
jgi:hypothetical protein